MTRLLLALLLLAGCTPEGRLVLTFDDDFVDQWHAHRDLLAERGVSAAYMVTRWDQLDDEAVGQLIELQQEGHEIGCHGLTHANPEDYAEASSVEAYVQDEVLPALELMEADGVEPTSYSYPWGGRSSELDDALEQHFAVLRDSGRITQVERTLFQDGDGNPVHGGRLDHGYAAEEDLRELLEAARREGATAALYTHRILAESEASHVKPSELEALFDLAEELELSWVTLSELSP